LAAVCAAAPAAFADQQKLPNLSDADIAAIVTKDIVEGQFLATGHLTRAIYNDDARFTDEIDT
jgi:hypothetical protein